MKQTRLGKRVAAWLLCLAMVLTAINLPSFTVTAYANEEYNFDDEDVLLFSGEGELTRDEVQTQMDNSENSGKKIARIEGYSSIGEGAFRGQEFEIVIIGDSVKTIRDEAFESIRNCKYIVLPNLLTCIEGTTAFWGARCIVYSGYLDDPNNWGAPIRCDKIVDGFCLSSDGMLLSGYVGDSTSITIPSGVDSIDDGAFAKSYLREIVIPAHEFLDLGDGLFKECFNLDCVKFEDISNLRLNVNPFMDTPNNVCFDIEKADEVSKIKSLYDLILSDTNCGVRVHPMYYDEVSKTCNVDKLPLPEPLPEKLFEYDADSDMFVLTVNDENKDVIAAYKDIRILKNHRLIVDTDLVIAGDLIVDSLGAITINKGCSTRAFYVDLSDIVSVKLGDKNCLAGLGIAADDVKVKHTGSSALYDMDPDDIDDTEFMKENGVLVYRDGPDCGINMNSDGTCVSEDGETKYGDVYFEVYTNPDDAVPAYTGLLEEDFAAVDLDPAKFKAGSRIDFIVKAYNGKVLQTNGVRFPDNKNYISTQEEEAKADTSDGCKCSYILTEDPDRYLTVSVQFVRPDELLTDATFAWSYDEMAQQYVKDTYVSHGVIEVVSAYNDGEPLFNSHRPETSPYWSEPGENVKVSDEEGNRWYEKQGRFPIGTELIVRLIPDRGYQLTKFTISNIESSTTAVDGVNEYTFNLSRPDHYHLCAVFTPVEDKVDILTASGITAGSVTFDDTEVDSGTMVLNVSDATPDAEEKSAFETMADNKGYEVAKYINLESEQRFYKAVENATREQCWIVEKSELDFPANITLDISGLESEDVIVLHNHNGSYEEITATYENGQLSFSSQSLSNFAIAVKKTTHTCDSHSGTKVAQVDATCTTDGVKAYYECSCGKHFTDSECTQEITVLDTWKVGDGKITQRNHDFSESEYQNDGAGKHYRICALCTTESEHEACSGGTATCQKKAICSHCKTEYGELAAHTWDAGEITKAATCKDKGVKTFKCTVTGCTATKTEDVAIDSTNHVNTEVLGKKDATCTEKGYTGDTHCKDCDETVTGTEIQATGHDMTKVVSAEVPATCEADGKEAVMGCKNCDYEEGGAVIPAKGHTWDAGTVTTPATCKTKGVKTFKCTVEGCTGTKTEEIAIDANNHVNTEVLNAKDATCTEKGYTGDTHCKDCDNTVAGTEIAATGHDMTKVVSAKVAATCEKDGKEAVMGCKNCDHTDGGAVIKATGHTWDAGKVTKQPTVTAEGVKTFKCTNTGCNETKTESIAKLPEPKKNEVIEDKTGNDYKVTDPNKKEVTYKAPANKKAKTVTIPASVKINGVTYKVTKVDDKAFKGNTTVTKVVIPSSVTVIGAEAFSGCKNLTTVSIPKNVTQIGKNAFKGCAKLTKLTLPAKASKIGASAFDGCKKMKTITIKSTKLTSKSVSANAFKGLSKNVTIKVPKKQLKAYKKLLKKKGFKGKVKV